ncbi:MAG: four helix bundle protein [Bacteroidetes bacterium]|nr:four helix bundle protein [Bacteroidota bacterium]
MKTNNLILDKTFTLALKIINLHQHLRENQIERDLCIQLLRSGTSIGANVEEAVGGSSRKDFIHKLQIAYREARESKYWLRLFKESNWIEDKYTEGIILDIDEILKILTSILKSSKQENVH